MKHLDKILHFIKQQSGVLNQLKILEMSIWKLKQLELEETEQAGEEHMAKKKSRVNEAGNYTKPAMRKRIFQRIKAGSKGGAPGQWSARKAQMLAKQYKARGGGYR